MTREMDLGGSWEILPVTRFDGKHDSHENWLQVKVPGHWQEAPGLDSHTGKAVYRKSFRFNPGPEKRYFIRLNGAFYWASVYLNRARLGASEGYFFPVDYEATGLLEKENLLVVEVDCPEEADKTYKRQLTGVFHHWDCIDPARNPGGIWLPVEILSTGPAQISDPLFTTAYLGKDHAWARITGQATIDAPESGRLLVRLSFIPRTFQGEPQVFEYSVYKSAGTHTYQFNLDLPEPMLWWTHDHGRPDLYTLCMEVFMEGEDKPSDTWETAFGIRTFELKDYIAFLNGRRLYLRGNNYPPGDARLAAVTRERCDQDVRLARECNLNLLRVHAHVDHPLFYQACDEQGMLVWQDFPMQWYYRPEVEKEALRQVQRMVFLLGSRPSIGVWCLHNEPMRMFDSKKRIGLLAIFRWLFTMLIWNHNRDRMDQNLARRARSLDPHRSITSHSGERGLFREPGDAHYYYGWYLGPLRWFHQQSLVNRYHIDRVRALKYKPNGGCVPFILLDSNPAIQWSVIDYWRRPKSSYYALQKAMSPVYAFTIIEKPKYKRNEIATLPVYAVNDTWEEREIKVGISVTSPVGDTVLSETYEDTLPADSEAIALANPELKLRWQGTYKIKIILQGPEDPLINDYKLKVK